MKQEPLVSIIIPTRNNRNRLRLLLRLLHKQSYTNIEYIVSDALSTDGTREVAKKYGARIIDNNRLLAEPGVSVGMQAASGDLMMILAVDNYYYHRNDIEKIISVFQNPKIYAAFPKHQSRSNYSLYSKYINTFTDPFNHFVYGLASNARTFSKIYKTIEQNKTYHVYDLKSSEIKPILAFAQGFTIRRGYSRSMNNSLDDITPVFELIQQGKQIAYVHSVDLYHDTVRNSAHFLNKMEWAATNALNRTNYGIAQRQNTLTKKQSIKKLIFPIYAISVIFPTMTALIYAIKVRKTIWLFHPVITFITGFAIIKVILFKLFGFTQPITRL